MPTRLETIVDRTIDQLFERAKSRFLGRKYGPKKLVVEWRPDLSLPGVFAEAAREEGGPPSEKTFAQLAKQATAFLEAQKAKAKAQALAAVRAWLQDAEVRGRDADPVTVLGGELGAIWKQASVGVAKIFSGEGQKAKNVAIEDAAARSVAMSGGGDPTVCFMAPFDDDTCGECRRLHFVRDGNVMVPRVWKLSQLKSGYAKRGDAAPSLAGQHIHCRGTLTTILPGYGFENGKLEYVGMGHDVFEHQKSLL